MQTRETRGTAFWDEREVAAATVIERAQVSAVQMALQGTTGYGYKDTSRQGPTTIIFDDIYDEEFARRLARLAAAAEDDDEKRRQRDSGERTVLLRLALDDGRTITAAAIEWPSFGYGPLTEIEFPLFDLEP